MSNNCFLDREASYLYLQT